MLRAILLALAMLGAPKEVATEAGAAIAKYARNETEAAFLLAWARNESNFAAAIAEDKCKSFQCDPHRRADGTTVHLARGLWQMHRGAAGKDWERLPGNIDAQTEAAARIVRFALSACRLKGDAQVLGAFRVLGGLGCDRPLKGEDTRMADYHRARSKL